MTLKGPTITLLAGALLAGGLLAANIRTNSGSDTVGVAAATPSAATAAAAAPAPSPSAAAVPSPASAPAQTPPPPAKVVDAAWAGRVDGGALTIAIVARDGAAIAYVCDGEQVEVWLEGTAEDGVLALEGKGKSRLVGTFGNGRAEGTVWAADNTKWTFDVPVAKKLSGLDRLIRRLPTATPDDASTAPADAGSGAGY